jgi:hypothetical protein
VLGSGVPLKAAALVEAAFYFDPKESIMKRVQVVSTLSLMGLSALSAGHAFAEPSVLPTLVPFSVEQLYIPAGFDDNDNTEVIVHGNLPNTCYKFQEFQTSVDADTKQISISALVLRYPSKTCLQMLIPFTAPVKLGLLKRGDYKVQISSSPNIQARTLSVAASKTESADDYLYAPVESAEIVALPTESDAANYRLTVKGKFPHMFVGCMIMKEVKVQLQSNNLVVVQPIAETVDDERCASQAKDMNYSADVKLQGSIPADVLIHVRSLNGQSYNRQYDAVPMLVQAP